MDHSTTSGIMEVTPVVMVMHRLMVIRMAASGMVTVAVIDEIVGGIEIVLGDPGAATRMVGTHRQMRP